MRIALAFLAMVWPLSADLRTVLLPSKSPLITFRFVFLTGAADDPADKPGLASLTASMLARGGSAKMPYSQVVEAMFPMATSVGVHTDKEMTTFSADTHLDNLDAFYAIFRDMILEPGWRAEDLKRLREDGINNLRVTLRSNNEEELGKEVLYNAIYAGHPYGHHNLGSVTGLQKITLEDLKSFHRTRYTQANLILGLAGGYPASFLARVKKDFASLPPGKRDTVERPAPAAIDGFRLTMVEKQTRSVAVSLGFPIEVHRGHADFPAMLVTQSYFGQHRNSAGRLFDRMREKRGLNYGDYAYIEYFPSGMFVFEPAPNLARRQQIFQIWIRPLESPTAHFGIRLAMHELDRLVRMGMTEEEFQRTRDFLSKYVNLLTKTKRAELGYAIDSLYYGIPEYNKFVKDGLAKLSRDKVNTAIKKHLRVDNLHMVVIANDAGDWKKRLLGNAPSPMTYNSAKPEDILAEDKIVEKRRLPLKAENITIVPVEKIFE